MNDQSSTFIYLFSRTYMIFSDWRYTRSWISPISQMSNVSKSNAEDLNL